VKTPKSFTQLISPGKRYVSGAVTIRNVICGVFIALIALFFTSPDQPRSVYDQPLPLPAELGLE
jgi:hypothetical protein